MVMTRRSFFITLQILSSVLATLLLFLVLYQLCAVETVSIKEINFNPNSFDGAHVRLQGYVVKNSGYIFGPRYVLRDFDNGVEIALGGKGGSENEADLESYVSFLFDGSNYTQIRDLTVSVVGHIRYVGPVVDVAPFSLEVEKVIDQ
jgi:hypothetical protein